MTFKPAIWRPIAFVLAAVNLGGAWFAARDAEPWHAATHAALAVAFGLWAQYLRTRRSATLEAGSGEQQERLEALEGEVGSLRQSLLEAHERLDFTERLLAQAAERRAAAPPSASPPRPPG